MTRRKLPEMIFQVEQTDEGGYVARTSDGSVFAQAQSFDLLKRDVIQAVSAHLSNHPGKIMVRLQLSRVSTSLLVGYMAAIYAWLLEISLVLLSVLSKRKPDSLVHAVLFGLALLLTAIAWRRRHEFRALRGSLGRTPLTAGQMLLATAFVLCLSGLFAWVMMRLVG